MGADWSAATEGQILDLEILKALLIFSCYCFCLGQLFPRSLVTLQAVLIWAVLGMPECAGFSGTWLERRVCKLAGAGWKQTSKFSSSSGHIGEMRV